MTFNVRYDEALYNEGKSKKTDWAYRKELQVELIEAHHPDVVGMQEPHLHQIQYFDKQLPSYSWVGVAREDGHEEVEFNPVFYLKERLSLISSGTFWLSETPDKVSRSWDAGYTRICTWAMFEVLNTKQRFYVFNTHFDSRGKKARLHSARLLRDVVSKMPSDDAVFVIGDFNFIPESAPYIELTDSWLADSRIISGKAPGGPEGTMNRFRFGVPPKYRIDFIFVNGKATVVQYDVIDYAKDGLYASDHFPVLVLANLTR